MNTFLHISLHLAPFKLLLLSLILSSSLIQTHSVALSAGCQAKCGDTSIPSSLAMFVLAPILASTWIVWTQQKKKVERHRMILFNINGGNLLKKKLSKRKNSSQIRIYTAEDMKNATNNYSDRQVMERCFPGTFYRGDLGSDGGPVVVAKIPTVPPSKVEEFVDQLIFLSRPHKNVVKIMGCCLETSYPLLVYELHGDGNGTLYDRIHNEDSVSRFSCEMRLKAATGAAGGLACLQSKKLFHGNMCSANILLDDLYHAKLFYAVAYGNSVYRDPYEFVMNSKSDVYGFGVLLVELLMRDSDRNLDTILSLIEKEGLSEVVYSELMCGEEDGEVVKEVAALAARCLSVRPEERPSVIELEASLTFLLESAVKRVCRMVK